MALKVSKEEIYRVLDQYEAYGRKLNEYTSFRNKAADFVVTEQIYYELFNDAIKILDRRQQEVIHQCDQIVEALAAMMVVK